MLSAVKRFAFCMCIAGSGTTAYAQDNASVLLRCEEAIRNGDQEAVIAAAEEVMTWRYLFGNDIRRGAACLQAATGQEWIYDRTQFVNVTEREAEALAREAEAEAEALERASLLRTMRCQILDELADLRPQLLEMETLAGLAEYQMELAAIALRSETLDACRDWYARDHFSALTNPVCAEYLEQYGAVAPAGIDDYDPMELATLQARVSRLEADLLIIDSGTLPEVARMERLEQLRLIAIIALPEELQQQAQDLSLEEIEALRVEYERSLCD